MGKFLISIIESIRQRLWLSTDIQVKTMLDYNANDRGQVGIGTLIVFIAMVLVAAIAAGVLINTAGLLQSQAEATGEESSQQVSDRVVVQSVSGTASSGTISDIDVVVRRSPGAGDINLRNVIIETFAGGSSETLTFSDGSPSTTTFDVVPVTSLSSTDTLTGSADRAELQFVSPSNLGPGQSITITITTAAGGTAFVEKRAPSTITGTQTYRL